MREGHGACRKAVRNAVKHRSDSAVRNAPTRAQARDTPKSEITL
ncbi:MAG: hypothetical protein NZ455_08750 [Bacteroidia bacterium]|nr:hypothetical protein [Bacteroidia bacterium]MDW8346455.1 hypothetical protein [Bacteroidia bacterium]